MSFKTPSILVTGGAGFIGSNFVLEWMALEKDSVINLDKLTYAGNLQNLVSLEGNARHIFVRGDIGNAELVGHCGEGFHVYGFSDTASRANIDSNLLIHKHHLPIVR